MAKRGKGTAVCRRDEIERLRESMGLSIDRVAEKADLHPRTIQRILQGAPAYLDNIAAIAAALGATADQLIYGTTQVGGRCVSQPAANFTMQVTLAGSCEADAQINVLASTTATLIQSLQHEGINVTSSTTNLTVSQPDPILRMYTILLSALHVWYIIAIKGEGEPLFMEDLRKGRMVIKDRFVLRDNEELVSHGHADLIPIAALINAEARYPGSVILMEGDHIDHEKDLFLDFSNILLKNGSDCCLQNIIDNYT